MLEFLETADITSFGKWNILIEKYWDTYTDKIIYDVAIEYNVRDEISQTLVIFESENAKDCIEYKDALIKNIKSAN